MAIIYGCQSVAQTKFAQGHLPKYFCSVFIRSIGHLPNQNLPKMKKKFAKEDICSINEVSLIFFRKWVFLNCFLESPDYCSPAYLLLSWKLTALYLTLLTTDILGQIARGNFKLTENQTDDALPANAPTPKCCGQTARCWQRHLLDFWHFFELLEISCILLHSRDRNSWFILKHYW